MKNLPAIGIIAAATVILIGLGMTHRTEHSRVCDPTGRYTAICSYRTYLTLIPMAPGSSSDKPCFVKIVDSMGENYGEIPVPMIQMAGVEWHTNDANIRLVGEWDFIQRTCYYWSEDQNQKIYVRK